MSASNATGVLAEILGRGLADAAAARWLTFAEITAITGSTVSVSLDGGSATEVYRAANYTAVIGDVVLLGVVRGTTSVKYVVICKIAP